MGKPLLWWFIQHHGHHNELKQLMQQTNKQKVQIPIWRKALMPLHNIWMLIYSLSKKIHKTKRKRKKTIATIITYLHEHILRRYINDGYDEYLYEDNGKSSEMMLLWRSNDPSVSFSIIHYHVKKIRFLQSVIVLYNIWVFTLFNAHAIRGGI